MSNRPDIRELIERAKAYRGQEWASGPSVKRTDFDQAVRRLKEALPDLDTKTVESIAWTYLSKDGSYISPIGGREGHELSDIDFEHIVREARTPDGLNGLMRDVEAFRESRKRGETSSRPRAEFSKEIAPNPIVPGWHGVSEHSESVFRSTLAGQISSANDAWEGFLGNKLKPATDWLVDGILNKEIVRNAYNSLAPNYFPGFSDALGISKDFASAATSEILNIGPRTISDLTTLTSPEPGVSLAHRGWAGLNAGANVADAIATVSTAGVGGIAAKGLKYGIKKSTREGFGGFGKALVQGMDDAIQGVKNKPPVHGQPILAQGKGSIESVPGAQFKANSAEQLAFRAYRAAIQVGASHKKAKASAFITFKIANRAYANGLDPQLDDIVAVSSRDLNLSQDAMAQYELSVRAPQGANREFDPTVRIYGSGIEDIDEEHFDRLLNTMAKKALIDTKKVSSEVQAGLPLGSIEELVEFFKRNTLTIWDNTSEQTKRYGKYWYYGARRMTGEWAERFGLTRSQTAGVVASLSPNTAWFENMSMAERMMDIWTQRQSFAWTNEMSDMARANAFRKEKGVNRGFISEEDIDRLEGKRLDELEDDNDRVLFIRAFDQTYNDTGHRLITPDGRLGPFAQKADGSKRATRWQTRENMKKALSIIRDGSPQNISENIGTASKVRSFYNNVVEPESPFDFYTVDTWDVNAKTGVPHGSSATVVNQTFQGAPQDASKGLKGLYPIFGEAGIRAAKEAGLQPNQFQAAVWEAIRTAFVDKKGERANQHAASVWRRYKEGKISQEAAVVEILRENGGIKDPDWVEYVNEAKGGIPTYDSNAPETPFFQYGDKQEQINGFYSARNKIIGLVEGRADIHTMIHESGHNLKEILLSDPRTRNVVLELYGDSNDVSGHERFARHLERYFYTREAPNSKMAGVFESIRKWMASIYRKAFHSDGPIDERIVKAFDETFGDADDGTDELLSELDAIAQMRGAPDTLKSRNTFFSFGEVRGSQSMFPESFNAAPDVQVKMRDKFLDLAFPNNGRNRFYTLLGISHQAHRGNGMFEGNLSPNFVTEVNELDKQGADLLSAINGHLLIQDMLPHVKYEPYVEGSLKPDGKQANATFVINTEELPVDVLMDLAQQASDKGVDFTSMPDGRLVFTDFLGKDRSEFREIVVSIANSIGLDDVEAMQVGDGKPLVEAFQGWEDETFGTYLDTIKEHASRLEGRDKAEIARAFEEDLVQPIIMTYRQLFGADVADKAEALVRARSEEVLDALGLQRFDGMGFSHSETDRALSLLGETSYRADRRSWHEVAQQVTEEMIGDSLMLARSVTAGNDEALHDRHHLAMAIALQRREKKHKEIMLKIAKAEESLDKEASAALRVEANLVREEAMTLIEGIRAAGTEAGRALSIRRAIVNDDYTEIGLFHKAKLAAKRVLNDPETKKLKEAAERIVKARERAKPAIVKGMRKRAEASLYKASAERPYIFNKVSDEELQMALEAFGGRAKGDTLLQADFETLPDREANALRTIARYRIENLFEESGAKLDVDSVFTWVKEMTDADDILIYAAMSDAARGARQRLNRGRIFGEDFIEGAATVGGVRYGFSSGEIASARVDLDTLASELKKAGSAHNMDLVTSMRKELKNLEKAMHTGKDGEVERAAKSIKNLARRARNGITYGDDLLVAGPNVLQDPDVKKFRVDLAAAKSDADEVIRKIEYKADMERGPKPIRVLKEIIAFSRGMVATLDLSASGRQGWFVALGNPKAALQAFGAQMRALVSQGEYDKIVDSIRSHPLYSEAVNSGLEFTEVSGSLSRQEEAFFGSWFGTAVDKWKVLGPVKGANRAYVTFLNVLRLQAYEAMRVNMPSNADFDELGSIAEFINIRTGRGSVDNPQMRARVQDAAHVLFAPRFQLSRIQMLYGHPYWKAKKGGAAREAMLKETGKSIGSLGILYGLAVMGGAVVETDPASSDFLQLRWGDTRVDPLAGLRQFPVFAYRAVSGQKRSTTTGKRGDIDADGLIVGFARSKFNPAFGTGTDVYRRKDFKGDPITLESIAIDMTVPITVQDVIEGLREDGMSHQEATSAALNFFGVSSGVYDSPSKPTESSVYMDEPMIEPFQDN